MELIHNFTALTAHLAARRRRLRVAIVLGTDASTRYAVRRAADQGFVEPIFVGGREELLRHAEIRHLEARATFLDASDDAAAAAQAVSLVREGRADVLMKGLVRTDVLLHAVLHKEQGILPRGRVLTHIACANLRRYEKLLFFTDAAVIPFPTQAQRYEQVRYAARLCRKFGIAEPKIVLTHCTEKVDVHTFPFLTGYGELIAAAERGAFGSCLLDGPLDVKTACHLGSMEMKGIASPIRGAADALIFPDIEAANTFYKTITLFADAQTAGLLQGTSAPVVLTSRADAPLTKFYSLALAALAATEPHESQADEAPND